jgi:hypothetical protein
LAPRQVPSAVLWFGWFRHAHIRFGHSASELEVGNPTTATRASCTIQMNTILTSYFRNSQMEFNDRVKSAVLYL